MRSILSNRPELRTDVREARLYGLTSIVVPLLQLIVGVILMLSTFASFFIFPVVACITAAIGLGLSIAAVLEVSGAGRITPLEGRCG